MSTVIERDETSPPQANEVDRPSMRQRLTDRLVQRWPVIDPLFYAAFAGACILYVASKFYGYMHLQTRGVWSAPLDDVFIHFDYARATARGYPFQWSEGNGFSSGNTSLIYPFALAAGYLVGFRGPALMQWAALLACAATFVFLLGAARLAQPLGSWAKYLIPPAVLSVGALDWSLFSGMENAFHLGAWALMLAPIVALLGVSHDPKAIRTYSWLAGAAGALLYATRPESVICVASFAIFAAIVVKKQHGMSERIRTLLRVALPGAVVAIAQVFANRAFTGEWAANGAIAKLAINNPYMTSSEKWDTYVFLLKYVVLRNTQHHFSDQIPWGWLVPLVALIPLASKRVRAFALLLWTQIAGWLLLIALNGQVRWQNERYTMSAVAWLFVLFAMGIAVLASRTGTSRLARAGWLGRLLVSAGIAAIYWHHQAPNMRDQIWFFGRACRNILDQHLVAGKVLAKLAPRRVLVGDAGALMYASDLPGLDIIGLGGYHDLPFARAGVHGLGASLELIERVPPNARPDMMAIYPSWWGDLPLFFGRPLTAIPVVGNVICGGAEKVIYRADWSPLDISGRPRALRSGERVADELDVADLVSERMHGYEFPRPQRGFVSFRVLPDPVAKQAGLFDAGRQVPVGSAELVRMTAPRGPGRLIVRTTTTHRVVVEARIANRVLGRIEIVPAAGWSEPSIDLPAALPDPLQLTLVPVEGDWVNYHVWITEAVRSTLAIGGPDG